MSSVDDKPEDRAVRPPAATAPETPGASARSYTESEPDAEREPSDPGAEALVGTIISGRYRIERVIGEGGMGAVYQAEHTHMRKRVAVKVLHAEMSRMPEVVARFEREAMAAAHIEHPHVVTATDFGKLEDGSFFLALEYVEGGSLRALIGQGRLELGRALHITRQVASALGRAHQLGIVHRDLKPENVMLVDRDGDPDFVKVLDFGIAKVPVGDLASHSDPAQPVLTRAGAIYGTPEYMAPEQALGQTVDPRADLYALGIICYEMLVGWRPFIAESAVQLLSMQVTAPVPPMVERAPDAAIPPEVEQLVLRLLAKEREHRLSDAREIIEQIDFVIAQLVAVGRVDPRYAASGPSSLSVSGRIPFPSSSQVGVADGRASVAGAPAGPLAHLGRRTWLLVAGLGTVGLLVIVLAIVALARKGDGELDADGGPTATEPTAKDAPKEPTADERIRDGIAAIERGDYASGIEKLRALEGVIDSRPEAHRALVDGYMATDRPKDAMASAENVLKSLAPDTIPDTKLRVAIRDSAIGRDKDAQDAAFRLLETRMGTLGFDDLYDIAYGASGANYPAAAQRAQKLLKQPSARAKMTKELAVTVEVRAAGQTCAVKSHLERAARDGDERTLAALKPLTQPVVVGAFRKRNALACIQQDGTITKAIAALEERLKKR